MDVSVSALIVVQHYVDEAGSSCWDCHPACSPWLLPGASHSSGGQPRGLGSSLAAGACTVILWVCGSCSYFSPFLI